MEMVFALIAPCYSAYQSYHSVSILINVTTAIQCRLKKMKSAGRTDLSGHTLLLYLQQRQEVSRMHQMHPVWTAPLSGYLSVLQRMAKRTLTAGMHGSCHDVTCLCQSSLWKRMHSQQQHLLFDRGQYLLGDSGYISGERLVAAFRNAGGDKDKTDFNMCIAHTTLGGSKASVLLICVMEMDISIPVKR
ncbi:hypothetical protein R1flu_003716 [Riccia fluitans]|uniref:DDE Tnp4 domain-containing protein n=1 Tax=Riccia fluitans TaxID=41844 RepID=A0ABD1Y9S3_9MARC